MIFLLISVKVNVSVLTQFLNLFLIYNHFSSSSCSFIAFLDYISLPNTVRQALSYPSWSSAMVDVMQALDDNGTCDLVPLLIGKKTIGCH